MKKFDLLTAVSNGMLALLIGLSGVGCLATGMELQYTLWLILIACLFWAILPHVALLFKRSWLIILSAMVLWGLFFWKAGVVQDTLTLLERLTRVYDMAYGWGQPDFLLQHTGSQCTLALAAIASVCTLLAVLSLTSQQSFGVLTAVLLPVVPCLVVTDTVPATGWLFVLTVCLALVLLSQNVRSIDPKRASRLTAFLLIPVLVASWLLFWLNPKDSYHSSAQEENFNQRLMQLIDSLPILQAEDGEIYLDFSDVPTMPPLGTAPDWDSLFPGQDSQPSDPSMSSVTLPSVTLPSMTLDPSLIDILKQTVSLSNAGPRNPGNTKVMTVSTKHRGTLYLRERGYDTYTGTAWHRSEDPQTLEMERRYLDDKSTVKIKTNWVQSNYFVPYYALVNPYDLPGGVYENPKEQKSYSFEAYAMRSDWQSIWRSTSGASIGQIDGYTQYLTLPVATEQQAAAIVEGLGITREMDVLSATLAIKHYVASSANYDLDTPAMPKEAEDFAIWFLTESETGYCVHFATAATVLLRAAGIPARYVEGYIVPIRGDSTSVTSDLAHAWVEYYLPQMGWVVLEATPGDGDSPVPVETTVPPEPTTEPTEPETTLPTQPDITVPSTMPTLPTKPTITAPTVPTTVPTAPTTTAPAVPTSTAPATTVPTGPGVSQKDNTSLWTILAVVFATMGLGCAVYGQWQLRLWGKRKWLSHGSTNRQAIALWRESQRMAALRRQKAPVALRDLAWKAKFSQYTITQEELQVFEAYLQRSVDHLKTRPWYLRLVYRLIFAAY